MEASMCEICVKYMWNMHENQCVKYVQNQQQKQQREWFYTDVIIFNFRCVFRTQSNI